MKAFRKNILEEEIKNRIGREFFSHFDYQSIIGKIDFAVMERLSKDEEVEDDERISYLWAEAKKGDVKIDIMIAQLILTIGRAKTFNDFLPPQYIGAFDAKKMAFVPYSEILHFFTMNDFDWTVTPSDHSTKEFQMVLERVRGIVDKGFVFFYETDEKLLKQFIKDNFNGAKSLNKIQVDKNNFVNIYQKWLLQVKDSINVNNWDLLKSKGIIDGDFFLADLLSEEDRSIKDTLLVVLQHDKYKVMKESDPDFGNIYFDMHFLDGKKAYNQFWSKYERPPQREYWDYMIERRDLLVPQDVRERKGSFFTPRIWVEKSQEYLADYLGENWQDEYYIWDCAAGTGNLLAGLTNKYNIFASTLDLADVEVMKDRVDYMNEMSSNGNGSNLLKEHIFQFDFLNDDFDSPKVPKALQDILNDDKKRRKLIIYINPPYAEATNARTVAGTGENKAGTAISNKTYNKYKGDIGQASNELFAQFFIRIYKEIPNCILAEFSTLKILQGSNFSEFRKIFRAKLEKCFLVPANTFDNVKGQFPIGFFIWNTAIISLSEYYHVNFYSKDNQFIKSREIHIPKTKIKINQWINSHNKYSDDTIGYMENPTPDFQNNKFLNISRLKGNRHNSYLYIDTVSLREASIYFSVRHCIKANWLNDRDQFLYPNDGWEDDRDFQADCLAFTLFHGQNRIRSSEGENHWIPFREKEVNAPTLFASHFMSDYIRDFLAGKIESKKREETDISFDEDEMDANSNAKAIKFSEEASAIMEAGREIWAYYMKQKNINVNASFYDIREYFQGRNEKGRMNSKSKDETYTELLVRLRYAQKKLAKRIEEKVYKYGFLFK